jgi:hypothetical protein
MAGHKTRDCCMTSNERDEMRIESENRVDNRENRVDYIGK